MRRASMKIRARTFPDHQVRPAASNVANKIGLPIHFPRTLSSLLLAIISCGYLLLSLSFINRPGLEYDEVLFGSGALGLNGGFMPFHWSLAGHQIPLMLMPYIGAIKADL